MGFNTEKTFILLHKVFRDSVMMFTSTSPPQWLVSKEYNWWWFEFVQKLDVQGVTESEFVIIVRTS